MTKRNFIILLILGLLILDVFLAVDRWSEPVSIAKNAKAFAEKCSSQASWINCYMGTFSTLTTESSVDTAIKTLTELEKIDSKTRDCHLMAHAIASAEIAKNPKGWEDFLEKIDANYCTGGFIHGIFEGLSKNDPDFVLNEETLPRICNIIKRNVKGSGAEQQCAHISGHLLLVETAGVVSEAAKVCEKVPKNIQYQCFGGLFMENITRDNLVSHGMAPDIRTNKETTDAQEKLCRQYSGVAATGCWREISHMFVVLAAHNPLKTYNLCMKAPKETDGLECYFHAAGLITRRPDIPEEVVKTACDPLINNSESYGRCVNGVVSTYLQASSNFEDKAHSFCASVLKENQDACFRVIDRLTSAPEKLQDD